MRITMSVEPNIENISVWNIGNGSNNGDFTDNADLGDLFI